MHINAYKTLHQALFNDINIDEFIFVRKIRKRIKLTKASLGASYAMLVSSLFFSSTEISLAMIVAGTILIFYFKDRMKHYNDLISNSKVLLEDTMKAYIDSNNMIDFRRLQLEKLKSNDITKTEYLNIIKEEMSLLLSLIKKECIEDSSINIVGYKNSIENLFVLLEEATSLNLIDENELSSIKKKWSSDLQVLCNQYINTDTEVELKYLYSKTKETKK